MTGRRVQLSGERGQALVELVACVPVVVLVALALVQGVLAIGAGGSAQAALERGRVAAGLGRDPVAAARAGLSRDATVRLDGTLLRVWVPVPRVVAGIPLAPARAAGELEGLVG